MRTEKKMRIESESILGPALPPAPPPALTSPHCHPYVCSRMILFLKKQQLYEACSARQS
ncbi:unnamed protein product [Lupinus luteus]|uniref:Uncharacterized protein n=1 Tax=Lupinus luteus TaxID=3873 RepID=A0AAV1YE41_LUPLU